MAASWGRNLAVMTGARWAVSSVAVRVVCLDHWSVGAKADYLVVQRAVLRATRWVSRRAAKTVLRLVAPMAGQMADLTARRSAATRVGGSEHYLVDLTGESLAAHWGACSAGMWAYRWVVLRAGHSVWMRAAPMAYSTVASSAPPLAVGWAERWAGRWAHSRVAARDEYWVAQRACPLADRWAGGKDASKAALLGSE